MAMGQLTNHKILVAIPNAYHDIGKTCLGGCMHCPSVSSSTIYLPWFRGLLLK